MNEELNTKKEFEFYIDLCDMIELIKENYVKLELKISKKDSIKNTTIIKGFKRIWMFSYFFTNEDLKVYPYGFMRVVIESFAKNISKSKLDSLCNYDVFLDSINDINNWFDEFYDKSEEITKLLIKEMPNVYELNEDYNSLKKHKKDLINYDYSVKQHLGIEKIDSLDFFIKHIDEQQKYLTYKSSQIIKEKVVIEESIKHPFKSDDIYYVFQYLDKYFKSNSKAKYTYIFDFIKDNLENTLNETLYFDFIISTKQIDMVNRAQATAINQKKKDLVRNLYLDYSNNTKK